MENKENTKTDLKKILSISGQGGLFLFLAQSKNGAIVEALSDKKRSAFGIQSKITTLADVAIYTDDGEEKLSQVFLNMKEFLGDSSAPTSKSSPEELKAFFEKVLPAYDRARFYVSHMKKVVDWYNCLREYASLDFVEPEEEKAEESEVE